MGITKESSDGFLPLKAVVGAMSVLIRSYDVSVPCSRLNTSSFFPCFQQTSDNAEGMKDIERRVQSLSGVLASPVSEDADAEKERRAVLRRFVLVRIYVNSLTPLSGGSRGSSLS